MSLLGFIKKLFGGEGPGHDIPKPPINPTETEPDNNDGDGNPAPIPESLKPKKPIILTDPVKAEVELTDSQKWALDQLEQDGNFFLTGGAGTGKTFLLQKYIHDHDGKVMITAPTGIAAIKAGGVTLHRAFRIPIQILTDSDNMESKWIISNKRAEQSGRTDIIALRTADTLVIDEVSMARSDLFSYVMFAVNCIRKGGIDEKTDEVVPGHPLKVILCGDFFQLPPVIGRGDREIWRQLYPENPGGWPFLTEAWKKEKFKVLELKETVRQSDSDFAKALNKIRVGNMEGLTYLNKFRSKERQVGPTICATNAKAAQINGLYFNRIHVYKHIFHVIRNGDTEETALPCEAVLSLKVGAKVIFLVNDTSGKNEYQNGSFGTVVGFKSTSKETSEYDYVNIKVDNTGKTVELKRCRWPVIRYQVTQTEYKKDGEIHTKSKLEKKEIGYFSQIPLRLGWAITAHKSQGQTYNCCNVVDPQRFWAEGQLYVALSRAESIENLYITQPLNPRMLHTSAEVKQFYRQHSVQNH